MAIRANFLRLLKLSVCLFIVKLTGSCATVSFDAAATKFLSPEGGDRSLAGRFGLGLGDKNRYVLARDLSVEAGPNFETQIRQRNSLTGQLSLSIVERFDVFYGGPGLGVKLQFFGPTHGHGAAGDKSLAFALAYDSESRTEKDTFSIGSTTYEVEGRSKSNVQDLMIIGGYRTSNDILWYLNGGYAFVSGRGEIVRKQTDAGSNQSTLTTTEVPEKKGRQIHTLAGWHYSSGHFYLILEGGLIFASFDGVENNRLAGGGILGFLW